MPVPQGLAPLFQLGDLINGLAPHNVLATLLTGGQYRAPIYSEETAAEVYNPTQLGNRIPQVTFGYLKGTPLTYTQYGYIEPEVEMSFWVYNKGKEPKALHIEANQLWCVRVGTNKFPCQYEPSAYPLVYMTDIVLAPGGAREIKFKMPTPPVAARPGVPQQTGDVQHVRVEVNVTDESGNKAKLASIVRPQLPL